MAKWKVLALFVTLTSWTYADQGSFTNSGGSGSAGSGIIVTSSTTTPSGALNLNCPSTGTGTCAGGSLNYVSGDGSTAISAAFTSGKFAEGCSGGGKGGHVTCAYTFTGYFAGRLTVNGLSQAITGVTSQAFGTGGAAATGTTAYNSAYAPFYYSDSEQIHRSDDLQGTNQISFGGQGAGVGQFYGAYGIALDSAQRIYIADTYNCRVVRVDDMTGANWTTYGGVCGSGTGQFYDLSGIAVDSAGKIYVMDTGNSRLVRIDDMTGANWVAFGAVGSGTGQLASFTSVAVDAAGRIYIADAGNLRIVRMDDMTGANWTALTQSPPVNGVSRTFQSPIAVAVDSAGRVYIADNEYYQPAVVRVDDMTGANWTQIYTGPGNGLNSISVDSSGTAFTGGGGIRMVDNMAGVLTSSGAVGPIGSYYVFGVTPVPLPNPRPSAIGLSPAALTISQNVGTPSAPQPVTVSNFGGSLLNLGGVSAAGGFGVTNNCPASLLPGAACTLSVTFTPSAAGQVDGSLTVTDDSGNAGAAQSIALTGVGTAPAASATPTQLSFSSQVQNTTSAARSVFLKNTGTGPLQVSGVTAPAPFSQTNNCAAAVAPGVSCTILVSFTPTAIGSVAATLTIADNAGTQTVRLSGAGVAPVSASPSTLSLGAIAVGYTSAPKTVTLTNRSTVAVNFSTIESSAAFNITSNTCGVTVAAGISCIVGVTFSPAAMGNATGTLTFTDDAVNSPQTVNLTGTGSPPVTLSSNTLNLGTVAVGAISSTRTVTLTNRQPIPLSFSSIATTAGFNIATNTCGASIAGGASCAIGVTYSPTAPGPTTGALTFADDAPNTPQTVTLTGTGR